MPLQEILRVTDKQGTVGGQAIEDRYPAGSGKMGKPVPQPVERIT